MHFTDIFVTLYGCISAFFTLLAVFPDVVVSKGGYASVPVTSAAHLLGIPVVIHESDVKPGRANLMASKYAKRIAVTFDSSVPYFPKKAQANIARTGIPIRSIIANPETEGAKESFGLDPSVPTILVLGGSQGAVRVNDIIQFALPQLTEFANVIHQTGKDNFEVAERTAKLMLEKSARPDRYHPFPYLNALTMRRAAGAADLVVSRAGMTAVAEIALWKKPSILIPIPEEVSHDQRANAYAYAETGAAVVIEEANLTDHILVSEAKRILGNPAEVARMSAAGVSFANPDAGKIIATEVVAIALSHEGQK